MEKENAAHVNLVVKCQKWKNCLFCAKSHATSRGRRRWFAFALHTTVALVRIYSTNYSHLDMVPRSAFGKKYFLWDKICYKTWIYKQYYLVVLILNIGATQYIPYNRHCLVCVWRMRGLVLVRRQKRGFWHVLDGDYLLFSLLLAERAWRVFCVVVGVVWHH